MRNYVTFLMTVIILAGCNKKKLFDGPNSYQDNFDTYSNIDELLLEDDVKWSYTQSTKPENLVSVDTSKFLSAEKSLKFTAQPTDDEGASKSSIAKHNMAFWKGETVRMSASYFLEGTNSLEWLFLMDLEEQAIIGAGPGMRLALVDNKLRVEFKFYQKDILQIVGQEIDFPRDEWVDLVWEVKLERKDKGTVKLWQNGQLIIDASSRQTLPKDILYSQQGTKGMYSSCEFGITANSSENAATLWVDDVSIERVD